MPGQYDAVTGMNFNFGNGDENPSGIGEEAYFIPRPFFAVNGVKKPTDNATAGGLVTIPTAHVLLAGKAPLPLTPLFDKSGINWETVGEILSQIFATGGEFFVPSNVAAVLGSIQAWKTYTGIFLIRKLGTNHFWQIGSEEIWAKIEKISGGTGIGPTGAPGNTITVKSHSISPVFIYTAGIPAPAP